MKINKTRDTTHSRNRENALRLSLILNIINESTSKEKNNQIIAH